MTFSGATVSDLHLGDQKVTWKKLVGGGFKMFQIFFYSQPSLGKISNLTSIFFRWVETTNQFS